MRFASGFATGVIALICAEIAAWGVLVAPSYRDAFRAFRGELPAVSQLALSPVWIFGLAVALAAAAVVLNSTPRWSDRSRAVTLGVLAAVAIALAIGTALAGVYPIAQLAGSISAE